MDFPFDVSKIKMLLAEDDELNRKMMTAIFSKFGLTPDIAKNGLEVLERLNDNVYDLILMDMSMPVMDGIQATVKIREMEKQTGSHIIIIAVTANASRDDIDRCYQAGMDDFITKPIKIDEMLQIIKKNT